MKTRKSKKRINLVRTKIQLFACAALLSSTLKAQLVNSDQMHSKVYNLSSFSSQQKQISDELLKLTPEKYQSNPDFGYLPYDAPCEDCIELLQYRTDSARLFVEKGTNGTSFYSQKCL